MKACPECNAHFRGSLSYCPLDGATLQEAEDPFVGRTIAGRYLVEEKLGSGGMGTVYRARHRVIGRDVALKFLEPRLSKDQRQRQRFLGEARAANQIDHEHIIDISDYGETEDGTVYMVMEYLRGRTLAFDIKQGPMDPRRALRIARQVALGLGRAHELGVVHRDVKPANIYLMQRKHDPDFVKLLDFGVARIQTETRITAQGTIVGTPEYIAPEQIRSGAASASSDLYALGCVLFEMLTGRLPFTGKTTMLLVKHLNDPAPAPSSIVSCLHASIDELVLRLLEKMPESRHKDAYHLAEDLQRLLETLPATRAVKSSSAPEPRESGAARVTVLEEDDYERTLRVFRDLVSRAHPAGDAPKELHRAFQFVETTIADTRALRTRLNAVTKRASDKIEEARRPRGQIGRALDELARDDSRISRKLTALERKREELTSQLLALIDDASRARPQLMSLNDSTAPIKGRLGPVLDTLAALSVCRAALAKVVEEQQQVAESHKDLAFQIGQLKDQLSSAHQASTMDQEVLHEEINRVDGQLQHKLSALAGAAGQLTAYFQRFPELRGGLEKARSKAG